MTLARPAFFLAAALLLLGGCESRSAEERINEAVPLSKAAAKARSQLRASLEEGGIDAAPVEAALATRLRLRALECARGYEPGMFDEPADIAEKLEGQGECFAAQDEQVAEWIGGRRVGALLAAGPLRPVPAAIAGFTAPGPVGHVDFARQAGVALVSGRGDLWIIDLNDGEVISSGHVRGDDVGPSRGLLSANGRLYATWDKQGAEIRDAASGDRVLALPGISWVQWVRDVGVFVSTRANRETGERGRLSFRDLTTGLETPIEIHNLGQMVPIPGKPDRYLMVGVASDTHVMQLQHAAAGWKPVFTAVPERVWMIADAENSATADGRYLLDARGPFLDVLDVTTLHKEQVSLAPFHPIVAYATKDPDQVLMYGDYVLGPNSTPEWLLYSLSKRTAAPAGPGLERGAGWVAHVASTRQVVKVLGQAVRPLKVEPVAPMADAAIVLPARYAEVVAEVDAALERKRMMGGFDYVDRADASAASTNLLPIQGPVLELAKTARVHGISVYNGTRDPGQSYTYENRAGTVRVNVMRTQGPIILVLTSYDPVRWVVTTDPGAEVGAILLGSYEAGGDVMGSLAPVVGSPGTELEFAL